MKFTGYLFILLIPCLVKAQDFNYVHYDTKDGLAGSTVYTMCQDKDGFIWFATDNGLSRYDGTNFKNFTVKDGLPDNEVLKVYTDSKGRVWIVTFSKELCFYYNGKIHNKGNDSLVVTLKFDKILNAIVEDSAHFLFISSFDSIVVVTPKDSIIKYKFEEICNKKNASGTVSNYWGEARVLINKKDLYFYDDLNFTWKKKGSLRSLGDFQSFKDTATIVSIKYDTLKLWFTKEIAVGGRIISNIMKGSYMEYIATTNGAWSVDTIAEKLNKHYLPEKKISSVVVDTENNLWLSSLGEGVFKLPSKTVQTFSFSSEMKTSEKEVFSIAAHKNEVIAGGEFGRAVLVNENFETKKLNFKQYEQFSSTDPASNRLYTIQDISSSIVVLGFNDFLIKLEHEKPVVNYLYTIKSIDKIDDEYIIAGTSYAAFKMCLQDLKIIDTIWHGRCTRVFYQNNKYYIGTLNGLYEVKEDKSYTYLGNLHPVLKRRITDIKSDQDGTLWVSTSDNGIISIKNGKIKNVINDSIGLSSNICKTLFINGITVWVGTDKGINKIEIVNGQYHIIKYTTSDGLPSNVINAIYVKDSLVWVGSPAGLTYFNENSISQSSMCNLRMMGITVSGKEIKVDSVFNLSYNNNNVHFEYAGISFRSGGEITYHYKLTGLDTGWKTTFQNDLDYKSLPSGDFILQLYAVNKYGVKSNTITISFTVGAPFWKTLWFNFIIAALLIGTTIIIFNKRNKKTKERLEERNNFEKQFAALEQQALQSQMNPHFIFNCLNSIQQYILTNDKEKANQYLTGFAALIRQTLDISAQQSITVAEEASYLKKYLEMERMRFGDSFSYNITVGDDVKADYIHMPALLLQPYVENSLRHGIRYKTDGEGKLAIEFSTKENSLHCSISDNGVGRDKAAVFKSKQHIEYQSKGMNLTGKRIALLNAINDNKIAVTVTDLKNSDGTVAGTLVEINIPC